MLNCIYFLKRAALAALVVSVLVVLFACKPKAVIFVDADSGCAPFKVEFDASKTTDLGKDITGYAWDLDNDGRFESAGVRASYVFNTAGEHVVKLKVTDAKNNVAEVSETITVIGEPEIEFSVSDRHILSGEKVKLSWDVKGADSVTISQGIGTVEAKGEREVNPLRDIAYTLTATNKCRTSVKRIEIEVEEEACRAVIFPPSDVEGCGPLNIEFSGSSSVAFDSQISSYEWDFDNDGTTDATGERASHIFDEVTTHTVRLTVKDIRGNTSSTTRNVRVYGQVEASIEIEKNPMGGLIINWSATEAANVAVIHNTSPCMFAVLYDSNIHGLFSSGTIKPDIFMEGEYIITAVGPCGNVSKSIHIGTGAVITANITEGCLPLGVILDASSSSGDIREYNWDFDSDGIYDASGMTALHTYSTPGVHKARLFTTDSHGFISEAEIELTVFGMPTASLASSSGIIDPDGNVTLTWSTSSATSVTISGIGEVASSGSMTIPQSGIKTYTLAATGPCGTTTDSLTITPDMPIVITITQPSADVNSKEATVTGTIANPLGGETMIAVNGYPAFLYENSFVASGIELAPGANTITVEAIGEKGNKGSASISLNCLVSEKLISITSDSITGISPMDVTLKINVSDEYPAELTTLRPVTGAIEVLEENSDTYRLRLTGEGIYIFTARTDINGQEYSDSVSVIVQDKTQIDTLLRSKWDQMKDAMKNGDVEGALENFSEASKDEYREIFTLMLDKLPSVVEEMNTLELVSIKSNLAKYRLKRMENIEGANYSVTYYVYFSHDVFGNWTIEGF